MVRDMHTANMAISHMRAHVSTVAGNSEYVVNKTVEPEQQQVCESEHTTCVKQQTYRFINK